MISLTLVLMLRLIPYGLAIIIGTRKHYKWLALLGLYMMASAIINAVFQLSQDVRALIASGSALLLLMHALELRKR